MSQCFVYTGSNNFTQLLLKTSSDSDPDKLHESVHLIYDKAYSNFISHLDIGKDDDNYPVIPHTDLSFEEWYSEIGKTIYAK